MVVYGEGRYTCAVHGVVRPGPGRSPTWRRAGSSPAARRCGAGPAPRPGPADAAVDPRNVYATTKLAQEHLAASWARATGGRAVSLRYHNVYGPGMPRDTPYAGVASFFRSALERGEAPRVFEDGGQRRDFVHVRVSRGPTWRRWPLSGRATPRTTWAAASPTRSARWPPPWRPGFGGPMPVVTGEFRLGDVRSITADSSRLREELGWKPEVEFADGVAEFAFAPSWSPAGG